jgi:Holliday junction resolvasome RuvABC endonuclease subunit
MPHLIAGIDPGKNGAFAFLNTKDMTVCLVDMPTYEHNGKEYVDPFKVGAILNQFSPSNVVLEAVNSSPQMGVTSAFNFGRAAGIILGAVGACSSHPELLHVVPSVWKPAMGAPADKKKSVARAAQLMPALAHKFRGPKGGPIDGPAEAAMLALYGAIKLGITVKDLKLKDL